VANPRALHSLQYEIALVVFPPASTIPLHDHPHMIVLSKVLHGTLHTTAYDTPTSLAPPTHSTLTAGCVASLLPGTGNIHCFTAGDSGCVVLDVLLPPYDDEEGRACNYYEMREGGHLTQVEEDYYEFDVVGGEWCTQPSP